MLGVVGRQHKGSRLQQTACTRYSLRSNKQQTTVRGKLDHVVQIPRLPFGVNVALNLSNVASDCWHEA